jgi:hypothetical protein
MPAGAARRAQHAPTAGWPLRYYVPGVQEAINVNNTFCSTAMVVATPFGAPAMSFEIEIYDDTGATQTVQSWATSLAGARWVLVTDSEIKAPFDSVDFDMDLGNFTGFATIHANTPGLFITAYEYCRSGTGALDQLVSMNAIEVYPVEASR